jgi:hypothetical protein
MRRNRTANCSAPTVTRLCGFTVRLNAGPYSDWYGSGRAAGVIFTRRNVLVGVSLIVCLLIPMRTLHWTRCGSIAPTLRRSIQIN